jgi:amino acid transporter
VQAFACTGFEYVPVPAGETVGPQRAVGLAMVASVIGATVLYAVVQVIAIGTSPAGASGLGESETALVDAARAFSGPLAASAVALVALISSFGFCSTSALVVPRYVESFAQDGFLPSLFTGRGRTATPVAAILVSSVVVAAMALALDFGSLVDTSNIAVVVQYVATCAGVLVMRRRDGATYRASGPPVLRRGPRGFRVPLGPLIPMCAIAGSLAFLFSVSSAELRLSAELIGGGLLFGLATRRLRVAPA